MKMDDLLSCSCIQLVFLPVGDPAVFSTKLQCLNAFVWCELAGQICREVTLVPVVQLEIIFIYASPGSASYAWSNRIECHVFSFSLNVIFTFQTSGIYVSPNFSTG